MADRALLDVQKLNIRFNTPTGIAHVVRDYGLTERDEAPADSRAVNG